MPDPFRRTAPFLLLSAVLAAGLAHGGEALPRARTLCGWFQNPTPGNAWLQDRDTEWVVGIQGGHQATGDWPVFPAAQWVRVNGSHGHGCACIRALVNDETGEVTRILSARARLLRACRHDRSLPGPTG